MIMNRPTYHKEYARKNRELLNSLESKYYYANRGKILEKAKIYYQKNKEEIKGRVAGYYEANKDRIKEKTKIYQSKNIDIIRERQRLSGANRRAKDPIYRLRKNVSRMIHSLLVSGKNRKSAEELLGYTIHQLKLHLKKQFKAGMTWENYGEWHIDHKIPISAFNISSAKDIDFKRCWALGNLQPLWKHENLVKSGKIDTPFQPSLAMVA
jgi:hypothetical protein